MNQQQKADNHNLQTMNFNKKYQEFTKAPIDTPLSLFCSLFKIVFVRFLDAVSYKTLALALEISSEHLILSIL